MELLLDETLAFFSAHIGRENDALGFLEQY
jgi:hypothetical protein